jgi:hypothetical protein
VSFGCGCLHNTVVIRDCSVQYEFTQLDNVSVYSGGASIYFSHLLGNIIDKVMSTAIPGEVWRSISAEQVLHLGLVEETGDQGDFTGRADRRSSENVRGNYPKCEGPTTGVSQEVTAPTFTGIEVVQKHLSKFCEKKRSFMRSVSPCSTN